MLDYIKGQLAEREKANERITFDDDTDDTSVVVECAHLFQEMDDLSVEGTDATVDRPVAVEIPLEDDLELETVELNIADGRITDVPMDANVQESEVMKTFDDFYQEAMCEVSRFPRDTDETFNVRVMEAAVKKETDYFDNATKKGLFGLGNKIKIDSDEIPGTVKLTYNNFVREVSILWDARTYKGKITRMQLDAFKASLGDPDKCNELFATAIKSIISYCREKYPDDVKSKSEEDILAMIGEILILVSAEKNGKVSIAINFGNTIFTETNDDQLVWSFDMEFSGKKSDPPKMVKSSKTPDYFKTSNPFKSKPALIKEYAALSQNKKPLNRFDDDYDYEDYYQEAIDFGAGESSDNNDSLDAPADADMSTDSAPEPVETPTDGDAPSVDANAENNTDDKSEDALPVETNDVSDDIAKKVSDTTTEENTDSLDDSDSDDTSMDTNTDVDAQLDELNDMGNTDASVDDTPKVDFDNMTMDDLISQGTERLKGMTMAQLKEFMNGNADANSDMDSLTQESFFLTKKNINKEVSDQLRVVSGILNNTELAFADLVDEFRKEGKRLNKVLSKAGKSKKVYTVDDMENINKLNTVVVQLMNVFKPNISDNEAIMVKRLIKEFVSRAVVVGDIVERVAGGNKTDSSDKESDEVSPRQGSKEVTQEGFFSEKLLKRTSYGKDDIFDALYMNLENLKKSLMDDDIDDKLIKHVKLVINEAKKYVDKDSCNYKIYTKEEISYIVNISEMLDNVNLNHNKLIHDLSAICNLFKYRKDNNVDNNEWFNFNEITVLVDNMKLIHKDPSVSIINNDFNIPKDTEFVQNYDSLVYTIEEAYDEAASKARSLGLNFVKNGFILIGNFELYPDYQGSLNHPCDFVESDVDCDGSNVVELAANDYMILVYDIDNVDYRTYDFKSGPYDGGTTVSNDSAVTIIGKTIEDVSKHTSYIYEDWYSEIIDKMLSTDNDTENDFNAVSNNNNNNTNDNVKSNLTMDESIKVSSDMISFAEDNDIPMDADFIQNYDKFYKVIVDTIRSYEKDQSKYVTLSCDGSTYEEPIAPSDLNVNIHKCEWVTGIPKNDMVMITRGGHMSFIMYVISRNKYYVFNMDIGNGNNFDNYVSYKADTLEELLKKCRILVLNR